MGIKTKGSANHFAHSLLLKKEKVLGDAFDEWELLEPDQKSTLSLWNQWRSAKPENRLGDFVLAVQVKEGQNWVFTDCKMEDIELLGKV